MNYCALLPLLLGCSALLGWLLKNPVLESSFLEHGAMNPFGAGFMVLTGVALISFTPAQQKPRFLSFAGWASCLIVLIGSIIAVGDFIFNADFNFSALLYPADLIQPDKPGLHLPPNTAICFLMLSGAIVLQGLYPYFHNWRRDLFIGIAQAIGIATSFMALLALIGYAYDTYSFYSIGMFTPMAMNTAFSMLLLCFGLLQLSPQGGLMKYIINSGPGGRMARLLLPASVFVPLLVGWTRLFGMRSGLYDAEFGVSLSVVVNILTSVALTWIGAWMLYETDCRRRESEEKLRYQATHDSLTGLANRAVFTEHLQRRLYLAQRKPNVPFAVFYMDLDGFKQVNDRLGHAVGDKLLVDAANVLRRSIRASDTAARFGGDEFTILFEEVASAKDVVVLAQRILETMPQAITLDGKTVSIGISIGIAVYASHHKYADDILRDADQALYRAKSNGKGRYELAAAA